MEPGATRRLPTRYNTHLLALQLGRLSSSATLSLRAFSLFGSSSGSGDAHILAQRRPEAHAVRDNKEG